MRRSTANRSPLDELLVRGLERAAATLDQSMARPVAVSYAGAALIRPADALGWDIAVLVRQDLAGSRQGWVALALDAAGAATLAGVAMADEGETYDAVEVEAERDVLLSELGNILLNGLLGGMQPRLGKGLLVRLPTYREGSRCAEALALPLPGAGLLVRADLHLGEAEVPLRLVLALAGAEAAAVLDGGVPT